MKNFLKQIAKNSKFVYALYFYLGSIFLKLVGQFVSTEEKLILFVVYGGQRYDDSPRFIYEYMKKNPDYMDYKYMWAFLDPSSVSEIPENEKIKIDTFRYYKTALRAKYWITNSSASRGLKFKKKKTINIMFQHGMAGIKLIGNDIKASNKSFHLSGKEEFDYIFIEGKKECELLVHAWDVKKDNLYRTGLPRNDDLIGRTEKDIKELKNKLNIPLEKKVILYAPTFREYNRDSGLAVFLRPPFDFDYWNKELGDEYVLLLTAHYEVAKLMDIPDKHPFVINAFKYPHINDLMLVSDILISDYSSIIWDYSILGRPIISYAYDYKEYKRERGVYEGYENIFSHGIMQSEEEVIRFIKEIDYDRECEYTKKYIRDEYIVKYGNAAQECVKVLFDNKKEKPERILHCVIGSMNVGGIEKMLMELYRNIDRTKYQFDFVVHDNNENFYEKEIIQLGGKLYRVPFYSKSPLKHNQSFKLLLEKHPEYHVIHIHTTYSIMYSDAKIAKKFGRIVVIHSHNSSASKKRAMLHRIYKKRFSGIADYRLSCSQIAADWMFEKSDLATVEIWKNAVELESFRFDKRIRDTIRQESNVENKFVIGCVGRLSYQKNQALLLDIFKKVLEKRKNAKLWLIGDGEDRDMLESKARHMGIESNVVFWGQKDNISAYLMACDIFVMTSRWEGLGVVLIEAQATGLPLVIPSHTDLMPRITDKVVVINDYLDIDEWTGKILQQNCETSDRERDYEIVARAGFDIITQVKEAEKFYERILQKS